MNNYKIIDNTAKKEIPAKMFLKDQFNAILCAIIDSEAEIPVGDMIWIRDELINAGYELWKDFSIVKL